MRYPLDFYQTSIALTNTLFKYVDISGDVLDCCAGHGAIASAIKDQSKISRLDLLELDIIKHKELSKLYDFKNLYLADATKPTTWDSLPSYDWIIANPPYTKADSILPYAFNKCNIGVAFLLRISFILEPCKNRSEWLIENAKNMSNLISFNPRPKFRTDKKGSDNVTSCWVVYRRDWQLGLTNGIQYITNWR